MSRFTLSSYRLVISIRPSGTVAALLRPAGERWLVRQWEEEPWPEGGWLADEAVLTVFRGLRRRIRWSGTVTVAVSDDQLLVRSLVVPAVGAARQERVAAFEVAQMIPTGADEVVWHHQTVPGPEREHVLWVAAWPRTLSDRVSRAAAAVGWSLRLVEPASLAAARGALALQPPAGGPRLLIMVGGLMTHLVGIDAQGRVQSFRTVPVGSAGAVERSAAQAGAAPGNDMPGVAEEAAGRDGADWIHAELARRLILLRREGVERPQVVLLGDDPRVRAWGESWAEQLQLPIVTGAEAGGAGAFPPQVGHLTWTELVGLSAARSHAATPRLDLRPSEQRKAEPRRQARRWWGFAGVAYALALAAVPWLWIQQARAAEARAGWLAEASQRAAEQQAERRVEKLACSAVQAEWERWWALERARVFWGAFLDEVQARVGAAGEEAWLEELRVEPAAGAVRKGRRGAGASPTRTASTAARRSAGDALPLEATAGNDARVRLVGRVVDPDWHGEGAATDAYQRAKRVLDQLGASRWVVRLDEERFDAAQPPLVRFEAVLIVKLDVVP